MTVELQHVRLLRYRCRGRSSGPAGRVDGEAKMGITNSKSSLSREKAFGQ